MDYTISVIRELVVKHLSARPRSRECADCFQSVHKSKTLILINGILLLLNAADIEEQSELWELFNVLQRTDVSLNAFCAKLVTDELSHRSIIEQPLLTQAIVAYDEGDNLIRQANEMINKLLKSTGLFVLPEMWTTATRWRVPQSSRNSLINRLVTEAYEAGSVTYGLELNHEQKYNLIQAWFLSERNKARSEGGEEKMKRVEKTLQELKHGTLINGSAESKDTEKIEGLLHNSTRLELLRLPIVGIPRKSDIIQNNEEFMSKLNIFTDKSGVYQLLNPFQSFVEIFVERFMEEEDYEIMPQLYPKLGLMIDTSSFERMLWSYFRYGRDIINFLADKSSEDCPAVEDFEKHVCQFAINVLDLFILKHSQTISPQILSSVSSILEVYAVDLIYRFDETPVIVPTKFDSNWKSQIPIWRDDLRTVSGQIQEQMNILHKFVGTKIDQETIINSCLNFVHSFVNRLIDYQEQAVSDSLKELWNTEKVKQFVKERILTVFQTLSISGESEYKNLVDKLTHYIIGLPLITLFQIFDSAYPLSITDDNVSPLSQLNTDDTRDYFLRLLGGDYGIKSHVSKMLQQVLDYTDVRKTSDATMAKNFLNNNGPWEADRQTLIKMIECVSVEGIFAMSQYLSRNIMNDLPSSVAGALNLTFNNEDAHLQTIHKLVYKHLRGGFNHYARPLLGARPNVPLLDRLRDISTAQLQTFLKFTYNNFAKNLAVKCLTPKFQGFEPVLPLGKIIQAICIRKQMIKYDRIVGIPERFDNRNETELYVQKALVVNICNKIVDSMPQINSRTQFAEWTTSVLQHSLQEALNSVMVLKESQKEYLKHIVTTILTRYSAGDEMKDDEARRGLLPLMLQTVFATPSVMWDMSIPATTDPKYFPLITVPETSLLTNTIKIELAEGKTFLRTTIAQTQATEKSQATGYLLLKNMMDRNNEAQLFSILAEEKMFPRPADVIDEAKMNDLFLSKYVHQIGGNSAERKKDVQGVIDLLLSRAIVTDNIMIVRSQFLQTLKAVSLLEKWPWMDDKKVPFPCPTPTVVGQVPPDLTNKIYATAKRFSNLELIAKNLRESAEFQSPTFAIFRDRGELVKGLVSEPNIRQSLQEHLKSIIYFKNWETMNFIAAEMTGLEYMFHSFLKEGLSENEDSIDDEFVCPLSLHEIRHAVFPVGEDGTVFMDHAFERAEWIKFVESSGARKHPLYGFPVSKEFREDKVFQQRLDEDRELRAYKQRKPSYITNAQLVNHANAFFQEKFQKRLPETILKNSAVMIPDFVVTKLEDGVKTTRRIEYSFEGVLEKIVRDEQSLKIFTDSAVYANMIDSAINLINSASAPLGIRWSRDVLIHSCMESVTQSLSGSVNEDNYCSLDSIMLEKYLQRMIPKGVDITSSNVDMYVSAIFLWPEKSESKPIIRIDPNIDRLFLNTLGLADQISVIVNPQLLKDWAGPLQEVCLTGAINSCFFGKQRMTPRITRVAELNLTSVKEVREHLIKVIRGDSNAQTGIFEMRLLISSLLTKLEWSMSRLVTHLGQNSISRKLEDTRLSESQQNVFGAFYRSCVSNNEGRTWVGPAFAQKLSNFCLSNQVFIIQERKDDTIMVDSSNNNVLKNVRQELLEKFVLDCPNPTITLSLMKRFGLGRDVDVNKLKATPYPMVDNNFPDLFQKLYYMSTQMQNTSQEQIEIETDIGDNTFYLINSKIRWFQLVHNLTDEELKKCLQNCYINCVLHPLNYKTFLLQQQCRREDPKWKVKAVNNLILSSDRIMVHIPPDGWVPYTKLFEAQTLVLANLSKDFPVVSEHMGRIAEAPLHLLQLITKVDNKNQQVFRNLNIESIDSVMTRKTTYQDWTELFSQMFAGLNQTADWSSSILKILRTFDFYQKQHFHTRTMSLSAYVESHVISNLPLLQFSGIRMLDFSYNHRLEDGDLIFGSGMPLLEYFSVAGCKNVTFTGLSSVKDLPALTFACIDLINTRTKVNTRIYRDLSKQTRKKGNLTHDEREKLDKVSATLNKNSKSRDNFNNSPLFKMVGSRNQPLNTAFYNCPKLAKLHMRDVIVTDEVVFALCGLPLEELDMRFCQGLGPNLDPAFNEGMVRVTNGFKATATEKDITEAGDADTDDLQVAATGMSIQNIAERRGLRISKEANLGTGQATARAMSSMLANTNVHYLRGMVKDATSNSGTARKTKTSTRTEMTTEKQTVTGIEKNAFGTKTKTEKEKSPAEIMRIQEAREEIIKEINRRLIGSANVIGARRRDWLRFRSKIAAQTEKEIERKASDKPEDNKEEESDRKEELRAEADGIKTKRFRLTEEEKDSLFEWSVHPPTVKQQVKYYKKFMIEPRFSRLVRNGVLRSTLTTLKLADTDVSSLPLENNLINLVRLNVDRCFELGYKDMPLGLDLLEFSAVDTAFSFGRKKGKDAKTLEYDESEEYDAITVGKVKKLRHDPTRLIVENISNLNLTGCKDIGEDAMSLVSTRLTKAKIINLSGCDLTDDMIRHLGGHNTIKIFHGFGGDSFYPFYAREVLNRNGEAVSLKDRRKPLTKDEKDLNLRNPLTKEEQKLEDERSDGATPPFFVPTLDRVTGHNWGSLTNNDETKRFEFLREGTVYRPLANLETLDLSNNDRITGSGLKYIGQHWQNAKVLTNIAENVYITIKTVIDPEEDLINMKYIKNLLNYQLSWGLICPVLHRIDLKNCKSLNLALLGPALEGLDELHFLSLSPCYFYEKPKEEEQKTITIMKGELTDIVKRRRTGHSLQTKEKQFENQKKDRLRELDIINELEKRERENIMKFGEKIETLESIINHLYKYPHLRTGLTVIFTNNDITLTGVVEEKAKPLPPIPGHLLANWVEVKLPGDSMPPLDSIPPLEKDIPATIMDQFPAVPDLPDLSVIPAAEFPGPRMLDMLEDRAKGKVVTDVINVDQPQVQQQAEREESVTARKRREAKEIMDKAREAREQAKEDRLYNMLVSPEVRIQNLNRPSAMEKEETKKGMVANPRDERARKARLEALINKDTEMEIVSEQTTTTTPTSETGVEAKDETTDRMIQARILGEAASRRLPVIPQLMAPAATQPARKRKRSDEIISNVTFNAESVSVRVETASGEVFDDNAFNYVDFLPAGTLDNIADQSDSLVPPSVSSNIAFATSEYTEIDTKIDEEELTPELGRLLKYSQPETLHSYEEVARVLWRDISGLKIAVRVTNEGLSTCKWVMVKDAISRFEVQKYIFAKKWFDPTFTKEAVHIFEHAIQANNSVRYKVQLADGSTIKTKLPNDDLRRDYDLRNDLLNRLVQVRIYGQNVFGTYERNGKREMKQIDTETAARENAPALESAYIIAGKVKLQRIICDRKRTLKSGDVVDTYLVEYVDGTVTHVLLTDMLIASRKHLQAYNRLITEKPDIEVKESLESVDRLLLQEDLEEGLKVDLLELKAELSTPILKIVVDTTVDSTKKGYVVWLENETFATRIDVPEELIQKYEAVFSSNKFIEVSNQILIMSKLQDTQTVLGLDEKIKKLKQRLADIRANEALNLD